MSNKNEGSQNAKVLKLGLNISVSGDPGTDFEIVLDDKDEKAIKSSVPNEESLQNFDALGFESSISEAPKPELEKINTQEVTYSQSDATSKYSNKNLNFETSKMSGTENIEDSAPQEPSIITKLKNTMDHFEKFSDHIKEIPRLRNRPLATSTPLSDKYNSRSESSLVYLESRPRKYPHLYDYYSKKEYYKSSFKPSPPNLFLKPLPGESCHMRGVYTRYFDLEPYRSYGSDNSLNKTPEYFYGKSSYDVDKYESLLPEPPTGILKKSDSESGDRQSTSSADSVKDIKIYQSGGILIMQNFKDSMDPTEKKEMSEFSAKLIENCNKLKMEVAGIEDGKLAIGSTPEEAKNSGKMVQFDLSSFEGPKSKSGDSSLNAMKDESSFRMESSESTSDCMKNKDSSPQGTSQSQDLTSLSTQENDSIMSNPPGLSPTYASAKKLEWDSGADIGYLNLDLTKENLSTIEKIVLKGLSSDGLSEENIVYEKKTKSGQKARSKLTLQRTDTKESAKSRSERTVVDMQKVEEEEEVELKESSEGEKKTSTKENFKDEFKLEESKPSSKKRTSTPKSNESQSKEKPKELTDKSVNVNTLFEEVTYQTPPEKIVPREIITPSESPTKASHRRTSHSPKGKYSKHKTRPSSTRRSTKKPSITGPLVASYFDMGNPKKIYKKVEGSPALNDVELSREVEEIIIDQRFKIKQTGRETTKESEIKTDNVKEGKNKSRPISASSSSNNTVLPKFGKEEAKGSGRVFADQVIQTSDYDCQSIGVQAFESQVQSDSDLKSFKEKETKLEKKVSKEGVNVSTKNIQAFGLNSSLPKQLEHPKGTEPVDNQNTKSTQYFGGALNSLPNYHSNVATKPQETCGRAPNVLKAKKNSETIRTKEENEKNILANDSHEKNSKNSNSNTENKENVISEKSSNSKKSQSTAARKQSTTGANGSDSERKESERKQKKKTSAEGSDCHPTSDDVSSLVLTSEALKVHGDSIDRSIIQEKYFQSQLDELEKRKMISRSTSMEIQVDESLKEYITTGCQYSPQSRGTTSGGQEPEGDSVKGDNKSVRRPGSNANQEHNAEMGDSLPSSTQTAHSWVPGMRNSRDNSTGVGKARSFEYLPGHIYESSGNLREELPSETEQNLITSSSDSDTARGSVSNDGGKDSEGRETLILENSTENSSKSDRLKILDLNLALLNVAVSNLREKDVQVRNVTKSLLESLCRKDGSGDWAPLGKMGDEKDGTEREESEISARGRGGDLKEFAITCQTNEKSPSSYYEERRALERRISEEKKCQIKWIENEIYHLNILRRLLEKQSSPISKKQSVTPSDTSKSDKNYQKNVVAEIYPRPVTPVYGCTISVTEKPGQDIRPPSVQSNRQTRDSDPGVTQYGVALSLSGNTKKWRQVFTFPASVQVSLKDPESDPEREDENKDEEEDKENLEGFHWKNSPDVAQPSNHCDVQTQYPSVRGSDNFASVSVQTEPQSMKSSGTMRENCFSINLSDKSCSLSSRPSERRGSLKLNSVAEDNGNSRLPECHHIKCKPPESTNCKCLNRTFKTVKSNPHDVCQSNVYLSCDTSGSRTCRCSKIKVQKSTGCSCHVIKIHGAKCHCSSERNSCSCKRSSEKKMENQSCQTECETGIKRPCEVPFRTEMQPCAPEISYNRPETCMERNVQEIPTRDKPFNCSCKRKAEKIDDHPRHYFLRIEEREVEDSQEDEIQQKKSLEVVTVTVPVKKAGRSKIYGTNIQQSREEFSNSPDNGCNCCSECIQNCRKPELSSGKTEQPRIDTPQEDLYYPSDFDRQEYQPAGRNTYPQPSYCDRASNTTPEKNCCGGCHCTNHSPPSRDMESSAYDSHKKRREFPTPQECVNEREYEGRRKGDSRSHLEREMVWESDSRGSRGQGLNSGSDRYNHDYYNYNKREYMTKSELAKEEERKKKVHQPSLQECLSSNRPDFYSSAERRRQIISERSKDRIQKHNSRMDCLIKMMQKCSQTDQPSNTGPKRIFTSLEMREQTMKRYKNLPEVTEKIADERKKEEYRTNRLMADIFAKKLQSEALKGHINLSNTVSLLYTI